MSSSEDETDAKIIIVCVLFYGLSEDPEIVVVVYLTTNQHHLDYLSGRADGCVVKVSARGLEGRWFDTRVYQLSD